MLSKVLLSVAAVFKRHHVKIGILDVILMRQKRKRHVHLVEISSVSKVISLSGQRLRSEVSFDFCRMMYMPAEVFSFLSRTCLQKNDHGSLQIICEYYQLSCPPRGSTITFHPLDHLQPLEYHRPDETVLPIAGSTIDLRSCNTSLEFAEVCLGGLTAFAIPSLKKNLNF